jgi:hypothetical protein
MWTATNIAVRAAEASDSREGCRELIPTLARIGDKWTVMVVGSLSNGPMRYNEIARDRRHFTAHARAHPDRSGAGRPGQPDDVSDDSTACGL